MIDIDQDEWDALNEAEGWTENPAHKEKKKRWMPDHIDPVLEELPKWDLVAEVLLEIEQEIIQRPLPIGVFIPSVRFWESRLLMGSRESGE